MSRISQLSLTVVGLVASPLEVARANGPSPACHSFSAWLFWVYTLASRLDSTPQLLLLTVNLLSTPTRSSLPSVIPFYRLDGNSCRDSRAHQRTAFPLPFINRTACGTL